MFVSQTIVEHGDASGAVQHKIRDKISLSHKVRKALPVQAGFQQIEILRYRLFPWVSFNRDDAIIMQLRAKNHVGVENIRMFVKAEPDLLAVRAYYRPRLPLCHDCIGRFVFVCFGLSFTNICDHITRRTGTRKRDFDAGACGFLVLTKINFFECEIITLTYYLFCRAKPGVAAVFETITANWA